MTVSFEIARSGCAPHLRDNRPNHIARVRDQVITNLGLRSPGPFVLVPGDGQAGAQQRVIIAELSVALTAELVAGLSCRDASLALENFLPSSP